MCKMSNLQLLADVSVSVQLVLQWLNYDAEKNKTTVKVSTERVEELVEQLGWNLQTFVNEYNREWTTNKRTLTAFLERQIVKKNPVIRGSRRSATTRRLRLV